LSEFGGKNITKFHTAIVSCLATARKSSTMGRFPVAGKSDKFCAEPSFNNLDQSPTASN
jgi:hypothetical protein